MLAIAISYYYPGLIGKCKISAPQKMSTSDLDLYPSLEDIQFFTENKESGKVEIRKGISLEMDQRVAEHFGFTDNRRLTCSLQLIEHILSLPDEEEVIFSIGDKKAAISAKMFRRIFHKDRGPDMKNETNNILIFQGKNKLEDL